MTWGDAGYGGDSSVVQDQLKNVQQLQASGGAFAAILGDGSVVTWGVAGLGGDSSAVRAELRNVQQIQAFGGDFAAILGDGSVVSWRSAVSSVGDSRAVLGSAEECSANPSFWRCFRCHPWRWICRDMGLWRLREVTAELCRIS